MSDGNTNNSVFIQNLFTSRDNFTQGNVQEATANAAAYVGQQGRIWWNPVPNAFYYSDGNTPGGFPITGSGSGNGVPGGFANTVQFNAGSGNFGGATFLTVDTANSLINLGNLTITDQTIAGTVANSDVTINPIGIANVALYGNLVVSPDGATLPYPPSGLNKPVAWFGGADGRSSIVYVDSFSDDNPTGSPNLTFRRYAGTKAAPTAVVNNQFIGSFLSRGFDGTSFQTNAYSGITFEATENFSPVHQGTSMKIWTIPVGSNTAVNVAEFVNNSVILGNFVFTDDKMSLKSATANLEIGNVADTGWVNIYRPLTVSSTGVGLSAFEVAQNGTVSIFNSNAAANTSGALNIVGTLDRSYQPVTNSGGMLHITGPGNTAARVTVDAFGVTGSGAGVSSVFTGRAARGTASAPAQSLANDITLRIGAVSWKSTGGWTGSAVAGHTLDFVALEDATDASHATAFQFFNAANGGGYTRYQSAQIQSNGLSFLNNTTANSGITFPDGSFQNTAYLSTSVVRSLTAGAGISLSTPTGNITITNTGVLGIVGTTNQISITGNVGNVVTLGTPQDLAPTSNVQFNNLTVNNLSILGNVSNVIPAIVSGPVIYVANTATTYADINNSGLSTGNVSNNYYASILYQTSSNTWKMNIGNSVGITAGNIYTENITANSTGHFGNAYNNYDFTNSLIQGDINIDNYAQYVLKNHSQTANASADLVAVANNGDDTGYYIDMGINSNVYANVDYAVTGANDGYLYVNGGNLVIGTQTNAKVIKFFTDGTDNISNVRMTVNSTGVSVVGNVTSSNVNVTTSLISPLISVTGNITGGNLLTGGLLSTTGNISGQNITAAIFSATANIIGPNVRVTGTLSAIGNVVGGNIVTAGIVSAASVTATGNIQGGQLLSAGNLSASGNVIGTYLNADVAVYTVNLYASGVVSVTGGISSTGNIITAANIVTPNTIINSSVSTGGNVIGANLRTSGLITATGSVTAGSFTTTGNVTANNGMFTNIVNVASHTGSIVSVTGNVTGNYFIGNGAVLTGLNAYGNVFANGTAVLATTGSSTLTLTPGNNQVITGNNTSKAVTIAVNDNPTFANLSVTGNITVFGNIVANSTTYLANVGNVLFANTAPLPTANPGVLEYDGRVLYFTPQDQERGIVPAQQWYVLNADRGLTYASTTAQSLFGVGAHLSNSTRYWFRIEATVSRGSGTNNTALTLGWRGTATPTKLNFVVTGSIGATGSPVSSTTFETTLVSGFTTQLAVTTTNNPPDSTTLVIRGVIDIGPSGVGTLDPYISWTGAAAAGSVTVQSLSNFTIFPLGVTGANTSVGNWS